jgi:hypothetical protein
MPNKRAKTRAPKGSVERPKTPQPKVARQQEHPFFCFKHIDKSTKETYKFVLTGAEAKEVLDFACQMAQSKWQDIEQMSTGGKKRRPLHHDRPLETIEACAKKDLVRRQLDETIGDRPLFRFRLRGEKRLWGFRSGQVVHAIWFDREHGVYEQDKDKPVRARKERRKKRK